MDGPDDLFASEVPLDPRSILEWLAPRLTFSLAVAVCAAAFPFWIARVLVVLSHYPLKRHLFAAADILRGSIDSSDYKNYILGLMFLKQCLDNVFQGALHHLVELVQGEIDAMIGDATLGEIVCADPFRAVAGTHKIAPSLGLLRSLLRLSGVE